jgi:hypothetical protein
MARDDESHDHGLRTIAAVLLLSGGAGYCLWQLFATRPQVPSPETVWFGATSGMLVVATLGLALGRWWGRWLGLAAGVAATSLAACVAVVWIGNRHVSSGNFAFFGVAPVLACLAGRRMFAAFDAPAGWRDDGATRLLRWTVITNIASLSSLIFANVAFATSTELPAGVLGAASLALLLGVVLLARRKTAGLFLMLAACAGISVAVVTVVRAAGPPPWILLVVLGPGLLTGLASIGYYARPMWRFLGRSAAGG